MVRIASATGVPWATRTSTWRSLATISSGLCLFLDMDPSSFGSEAILQGGPLQRGRISWTDGQREQFKNIGSPSPREIAEFSLKSAVFARSDGLYDQARKLSPRLRFKSDHVLAHELTKRQCTPSAFRRVRAGGNFRRSWRLGRRGRLSFR